MELLRGLERRLEAILERTGGSLWGGATHATELAGSILRAMDLAADGERVPNRIVFPSGTTPLEPDHLPAVARLITEEVADRGWRIEGPITLIPASVRAVSATTEPGPLPTWATLSGDAEHAVTRNRAVIGRHSESDVVVDSPTVSRRHAVLWHADGQAFIRDLDSANGTLVDGVPVGGTAVPLHPASLITIGDVSLRFRRA